MRSVFSKVSQKISEKHQLWQSLPTLRRVLILIRWIIMIPFLFAFTFSIVLSLVFVIPGLFLFFRWIAILAADEFYTGDMKVPTFYSARKGAEKMTYIYFISVVGVVFGGIHCALAGWFFDFPSSNEVKLWRVSSAVLTCIAFLLPLRPLFKNFKEPPSMATFCYWCFNNHLTSICSVASSFVSRGFHFPQTPYPRNACISKMDFIHTSHLILLYVCIHRTP